MKLMKIDSVTFPVIERASASAWATTPRRSISFRTRSPAQLIIQVERVADARRELEAKGVRLEGPTDTLIDYCGVREAHTPADERSESCATTS